MAQVCKNIRWKLSLRMLCFSMALIMKLNHTLVLDGFSFRSIKGGNIHKFYRFSIYFVYFRFCLDSSFIENIAVNGKFIFGCFSKYLFHEQIKNICSKSALTTNFVENAFCRFKNSYMEFVTLDDGLTQEFFYSLKIWMRCSRFSKMSTVPLFIEVPVQQSIKTKVKKNSAEFVFTIRMTLDWNCLTYFLSLFIIQILASKLLLHIQK